MEGATAADLATLAREVERRRTFAIISHPDAGKTTLTEKLLLYGGAIETAGAVRSRKTQRHATSDWMAMEQARGISVTSTALQFEYEGYCLNLLDTPGHQDFSEDTYRTLHATDSAVMVLDAAKGIEPQTRKLFQVCRKRRIPILGFINKLDHPGKDPFELLEEIEKELGVAAVAMNWPIGSGPDFQGVFDLVERRVFRFERTAHGGSRAPVTVAGIDDPALEALIGGGARDELREAAELLDGAGASFDQDRFLAGDLIPVYFGSAINNFGVGPFLQALLDLAPPPSPRDSSAGLIRPQQPEFSGFVFKIQANMDRRHRDRLAFLRVCSGTFEKDMEVHHARLGRTIRMTRPHRLFARERETVESAFPGDVIGFVNPGLFQIGDTVSQLGPTEFEPIPSFAPEHFGVLRARETSRQKQFQKGIEQLEEEGVIQLFYPEEGRRSEPVIGVVGELQFDLLRSRLASEYGTETTLQRLPFRLARWLRGRPEDVAAVRAPGASRKVLDVESRPVLLFTTEWELEICIKESSGVGFSESSSD
ncbi:MAG TPA: peptide chain release factor 3 [Thermoanaerobaculia bacterium]|nr:peptide chain release factor 3 [Thermoanaerobaculia bacterium]